MKPFQQYITFLTVHDLDKTVYFYKEILELPLVRDQGDCKIFRVSSSAYLGFCSRLNIPSPSPSVILTFITNEVDAWCNKLINAGAKVEKPPSYNPKYEIYHAFLEDPNGYRIEIQKFDNPLPEG